MSRNHSENPTPAGKRNGAARGRLGVLGLIRRRWWARSAALLSVIVFVALLPVPWLVARTPNPPGMAWRLDGRLQLNGETIDPPGAWYGVTAGRPPVVAEVVRSWVFPGAEKPRDMRRGSSFNSPAMAEPAAMAIGLAQAGRVLDFTTFVEVRDPILEGLPVQAAVAFLNGRPISTEQDWSLELAALGKHNEFVTRDGRVFTFDGASFPYRVVETMEAPTELEVSLAGWLRLVPESWYRNLTLGRSHGLILALAAYSHASGEDLAAGRVIGGTGIIHGDGSVATIGGLSAKASAAHRAGVEVLVYPEAQRCQAEALAERVDLRGMVMIPVASLTAAIELLRGDAPSSSGERTSCTE